MSLTAKTASLVLFAALAISGACAQEDVTRSALESRYAAMKSAMAAKNGEAISAILAEDFVSVDISGKTGNASQVIQEVLALPFDPNKASKTTLTSIKTDADKAMVEQRYDMKTKKNDQNGNSHDVELITSSSDTWVSKKGVWLLQRTETKQMDYTIDGKTVVHKARD